MVRTLRRSNRLPNSLGASPVIRPPNEAPNGSRVHPDVCREVSHRVLVADADDKGPVGVPLRGLRSLGER